jgi:hypothetical protein
MCGDLNNGPNSDIYRYMSNSFLRKKGIVMRSAYDTYTLLSEHHNSPPPTTLRVLSSPSTLDPNPFFSSPESAPTPTYEHDDPPFSSASLSSSSTSTSSSSSSSSPVSSSQGSSSQGSSSISPKSPTLFAFSSSSTTQGTHMALPLSHGHRLSATMLSPTRRLSIPDDRSIPPPFQPILSHTQPISSTSLPSLFRSVTAPPGALLNPPYETSSPDPEPSKHIATPPRNSRVPTLRNGEKTFKVKTDLPYGGDYEPAHTTLNYKRAWTIDYIWHSSYVLKKGGTERDEASGKLHPQLVGILEIPSEDNLRSEEGPSGWVEKEKSHGEPLLDPTKNNNGIPNSVYGSDHVPLLATFFLPPLPHTLSSSISSDSLEKGKESEKTS